MCIYIHMEVCKRKWSKSSAATDTFEQPQRTNSYDHSQMVQKQVRELQPPTWTHFMRTCKKRTVAISGVAKAGIFSLSFKASWAVRLCLSARVVRSTLGSLHGSHCKCRTSAWYPSSETMKDFSGYLIWSKLALGWRLNWEFPYPSAMFKAVSYRLSTMISPDLDPSLYGYRWRELKLKATIICSKPPATSQSQIPKLLGCAVLTLSCHHSTLEDQRIDDGLPWKIVGSTQNVLSLEKDIRTSIYHG